MCCKNGIQSGQKFTQKIVYWNTHPFNGPLFGSTRVSRYQKGKTNLDFTEARDSEWQCHQLGHMQVWTSLQTDNHASIHRSSFFYRPDALPAAQPTASKHWRPTVCWKTQTINDEPLDNHKMAIKSVCQLDINKLVIWHYMLYTYLFVKAGAANTEGPNNALPIATEPLRYFRSEPGAAEYTRLPMPGTHTQ